LSPSFIQDLSGHFGELSSTDGFHDNRTNSHLFRLRFVNHLRVAGAKNDLEMVQYFLHPVHEA
jgi:hypothetical protein